jgi:predicted helicase
VLLAYYIAAINIEASYHSLAGGDYVPFEGICLTDTFQMYEKEDLVDALLVDNSKRRKRQKKLDIRVIVGNPPYPLGRRARTTTTTMWSTRSWTVASARPTARSTATLAKGLYDSYIRAIRWASDRVGNAGSWVCDQCGVLGGQHGRRLRKCLAEEFSSIYVFHLRGNARTSGERRRMEKDNIFGVGSRAPVAISLLVKNPQAAEHGRIHFHDIGDYLGREEKLAKIESYASVAGVADWQAISPDDHGDWLRQRDDSFSEFIVLGDKNGDGLKLFDNFSLGVVTNRDAWAYNASKDKLQANMSRMIGFYNAEVARFNRAYPGLDKKGRDASVDGFIDTNPEQISWTHNIKQELSGGELSR